MIGSSIRHYMNRVHSVVVVILLACAVPSNQHPKLAVFEDDTVRFGGDVVD
jgi:hypothetical protein